MSKDGAGHLCKGVRLHPAYSGKTSSAPSTSTSTFATVWAEPGERLVVRKCFQQPVCDSVHLCDGLVYDPVPFDAGLEADGDI